MELNDFLKENRIEMGDIKYPIKKIKTTEDYVLVFLDDEKIMISLESYFKYGVKDLNGLDDNLYKLFKDDEMYLKAYRGVLRKISAKDHTVKQIRDYLSRTDLNASQIDEIINRLIEYDLLNDEKYCINKINYYNNTNLSSKQIRQKLIKEGVDIELIKQYLNNDYSDEYRKAKALAEKYNRTIKGKSVNMVKQTILNKLVSNGFSYEISKSVVDELNINNENELELLKKEYLKALNKYQKKYEDYELQNHIYSYLMNKGFKSEDIKKVLEELHG